MLETRESEVVSHGTRLSFNSCLNQIRFRHSRSQKIGVHENNQECLYDQATQDGCALALCTSTAQPVPAHLHPTYMTDLPC